MRSPRDLLARLIAVLTLLGAPLAFAQPLAPQVTVHSEDPALAEAVVAELRATGESGLQGDDEPLLVALSWDGDTVVVQIELPGEARQARVPPPADSGLGVTPTRALAIAEVVRSLLETESPDRMTVPAPPIETPSSEDPPSPSPMTVPGRDAPTDPEGETVFRLGYAGGVDYADPVWSVANGLSLRGQVSPHVTLSGGLRYAISVDDGSARDFSIHRAQAQLGGAWEILGVDGIWTPSIGLALRGEAMFFDVRSDGSQSGTYRQAEGAALGLTPLITAGLSFARPVRGRLDLEAGLRAVSEPVDGASRDLVTRSPVPVVSILLGLEYDVVTASPARHHARNSIMARVSAR